MVFDKIATGTQLVVLWLPPLGLQRRSDAGCEQPSPTFFRQRRKRGPTRSEGLEAGGSHPSSKTFIQNLVDHHMFNFIYLSKIKHVECKTSPHSEECLIKLRLGHNWSFYGLNLHPQHSSHTFIQNLRTKPSSKTWVGHHVFNFMYLNKIK